MADGIVLKLIGLLVLVICSALLTGAEAAYFSLGRARLKRMAGAEGKPKALIERPNDLLVTLLVGITLINIGAAAIATFIGDNLIGSQYAFVVEVIGMILLITTFGEVLPMTVAVKYPEPFLRVAR